MTPLIYALLAQKAYNIPPQIGAESSSARAILETTEGGLVIAFPGTNNIACWLADLDVELENVPGLGIVHKGFWEAFWSIHEPLLNLSPQVTCGHSEGGALAILYAAELCLEGRPPKAVYAFEPPRVTVDDEITALLRSNNVQVLLTQNGNDVVPMVPRLLHDWRHPAPLTRIGTASDPFPNVEDHLIENVIKALER